MQKQGIITATAACWLISTVAAHATCGNTPHAAKQSAGHFVPTMYQTAENAENPGWNKDWYDSRSIVGLWEFEAHLSGAQNGLPDNFLLDWGLVTWHEDGTEIQFSAGRAPSSGDVCMGAWKAVGNGTFKLHHVALGLTPADASGTFTGPVVLRSDIHVDPSGDTYKGSYVLTIYPGSPDNGTEFNESGTPAAKFVAVVTAKRVKAN
jgi:hypothetical protein